MRDASVSGDSVTFFRYVDWILTVPLMCVEFYLILQKAGAPKSLMWNLITLSTIMLVTGYVGEAGHGDAVIFGTISGLVYFGIVYILWLGSAAELANKAGWAFWVSCRSLEGPSAIRVDNLKLRASSISDKISFAILLFLRKNAGHTHHLRTLPRKKKCCNCHN